MRWTESAADPGNSKQHRFLIRKVARRDALDGADGANIAFRKLLIKRVFHQLWVRQNIARQARDF